VSAEPCRYAIRESRIGRVVYGLRSPHMGGVSKWPILPDQDLSNTMPEVFAAPPSRVSWRRKPSTRCSNGIRSPAV